MRGDRRKRKKDKTRRIASAALLVLSIIMAGCGSGASGSDLTEREQNASKVQGQEAVQELPTSETQTAGQTQYQNVTRDVFAMDTYMTISCYGARAEEAADAAEAEIKRLDALLSVGNEDSIVSRINAEKEGALDADTAEMVEMSLRLSEQTDGAFDITVYPLMKAWGFAHAADAEETEEDFRVPGQDELDELLTHIGSGQITYDEKTKEIKLAQGQSIDLGGIAKGFTSDRLMEIFSEYELEAGLVSLGGNVQCFGSKPDGSDWKCGIQDPKSGDTGDPIAGVLSVSDRAVITSGSYERFFSDDAGNVYHHILNPKTGHPAQNGLLSVTIVCRSGMTADGLSTACFVMGREKAEAFWRASQIEFDMILLTEEMDVFITEGIADQFETELPISVLRRS